MPTLGVQVPDLQRVGPVMDIEIAIGSSARAILETSGVLIPAPIAITAMIDTGASVSVMRQGTAARLGLQPTGVVFVYTAASINVRCPEYSVRLLLPNTIAFDTTLIEMPLESQHIGCLIGRDVLARGVFIYLGSGNAFTLSI